MIYAKIGAISYGLWSLLHIVLGIQRLTARMNDNLLAEAAGRLAQSHWTLIYIGLFGLIISYFNWKNTKWAYWVALFIISAEDIGFILFPVMQGGLEFPKSVIGPALWLIGLLFTTIAYTQQQKLNSHS